MSVCLQSIRHLLISASYLLPLHHLSITTSSCSGRWDKGCGDLGQSERKIISHAPWRTTPTTGVVRRRAAEIKRHSTSNKLKDVTQQISVFQLSCVR